MYSWDLELLRPNPHSSFDLKSYPWPGKYHPDSKVKKSKINGGFVLLMCPFWNSAITLKCFQEKNFKSAASSQCFAMLQKHSNISKPSGIVLIIFFVR